MDKITSTTTLENSLKKVCKNRCRFPSSADVWHLKFHWQKILPKLQSELRSGSYHLSPMERFRTRHKTVAIWSAQDALVLTAISSVLTERLADKLFKSCCHIKGHGGLHKGIQYVNSQVRQYKFVCKSDVASYYDSMDKDILKDQLDLIMEDRRVLNILYQFIDRVEVFDGLYNLKCKGIPKASTLSSLLAAVYLTPLDECMSKEKVAYIRYMDDWCILAKTRWDLKKAIVKMNQVLNTLKLEKAPAKTYIGKVEKGFEFLGFKYNEKGIFDLANKTKSRINENIDWLYEQGVSSRRIDQYLRRALPKLFRVLCPL